MVHGKTKNKTTLVVTTMWNGYLNHWHVLARY
jgi:hypothetical protein